MDGLERRKMDMRAYPMVVLLIPLVIFLLICNYWSWPVNLLHNTECETIDSLRTYVFVLQGNPRETKRCWRYEARVMAIERAKGERTKGESVNGRALLYIQRDSTCSQPQAGDTIIARTRIHRGDSIGNFDYGLYLRRQGIIGWAYVATAKSEWRKGTVHRTPLQTRLYRRLQAAGLQGDELATTGALTLGYKDDLDPALRQQFQAAGAAHVLAVSGLHTGIIYGLLLWLLTLGGRVKPRYENYIGRCIISGTIIAVMWAYAWLTGMTPSVVRAVVMVTIFELGHMLYRQAFSINTIAGAAVLILLVRPLDLWNVGFQLSFAATTAIVIMVKDMEKVLHKNDLRKTRGGIILNWALGIVIVSIAAQLGTLPISMYTFGQISNYFLLTNLIVLPLASLLVPCGLTTIALGGSTLGKLIGHITYGVAWLMNHTVGWVESLPGSVSHVQCSLPMVALLYAAMVMAWLTMHKSLWWICGVIVSVSTFCILFACA